MKKVFMMVTVLALSAFPGVLPRAFAESDTAAEVKEDIKEGAQDTKKAVRKQARVVKDKACELVNGKMECAGKKLKHRAQDMGDEVKDKVN